MIRGVEVPGADAYSLTDRCSSVAQRLVHWARELSRLGHTVIRSYGQAYGDAVCSRLPQGR